MVVKLNDVETSDITKCSLMLRKKVLNFLRFYNLRDNIFTWAHEQEGLHLEA